MHDASRVRVASAKSPTTGRTYWAMEIAGDYKGKRSAAAKHPTPRQTCRVAILIFVYGMERPVACSQTRPDCAENPGAA
jgi:hypothetical protein